MHVVPGAIAPRASKALTGLGQAKYVNINTLATWTLLKPNCPQKPPRWPSFSPLLVATENAPTPAHPICLMAYVALQLANLFPITNDQYSLQLHTERRILWGCDLPIPSPQSTMLSNCSYCKPHSHYKPRRGPRRRCLKGFLLLVSCRST